MSLLVTLKDLVARGLKVFSLLGVVCWDLVQPGHFK